MKIKQLLPAILFGITVLATGSGLASEQIMVDKEEYEKLKAAVEFLMEERNDNKQAIEEAKAAAEEATEVAEAAAEVAESPILEGLQNISLGGYGEVHYNNLEADDASNDLDRIDVHRFVLFLGYKFTDNLRFYSELELEHALAGESKPGEVELEQAFIEWDFAENTSVLGGVFLVPVGIINETHEPDTFYGVERNTVESTLIPATWWEAGAMLTHRMDSGFKIELAAHSGLEIPTTGDNAFRVRSGRQKVANADASHFAYTGAVTYTGIQGLEVGAAMQLQDDVSQNGGDGLDDGFLWTTHLVYNHGMFGFRALYADWDFDGDAVEDNNDDKQHGWYIEPSIKPFGDHFGMFARYEDVRGGRERDEFDQWTIGFNYWLHENVVLKADYQDRKHDEDDEEGRDFDGYNIGIGWSF